MNNKIFIKSFLLFLLSISVVTARSYSYSRFVYSYDYPVKTNIEQVFTPAGHNTSSLFSPGSLQDYTVKSIFTNRDIVYRNKLSLSYFNSYLTNQLKANSTNYPDNNFIQIPQKKINNQSTGEDPFQLS